jgi:hypothetical protein
MAAMHKERNCGVRNGWHGAARSGFARSDTERLARRGPIRIREECSGETRSGWQDMAWTGPATRGRLVRLGKARSGLATRGMDPQARSGVDSHREARIRRHGAAWSTRRDTERLAWRRKDGHRLSRLGWRGSALLRSDGTVLELLAWSGGHGFEMQAWRRPVWIRFGGIAGTGRIVRDRHRSALLVWHVLARSGQVPQCGAGLARHGNALHGLLRQAWQRTLRRGRAGMAGSGESQQGRHGLSRRRPVRQGLAGTARDHTVPQRTAGTARHGGADL